MTDQSLTITNNQCELNKTNMDNNNDNTVEKIIVEEAKKNLATPLLNDISPSTLEALKTLSSISSYSGVETITDCDKLRASLEQIRAKKNMKLFNKLDKIRQDFSGLNFKLAQMEESILDLKEGTSNFVKSLPPDRE